MSKKKFEVLEESEDLNVYWEEIRNILQESMEEVVPIKENKRNKKWMTEKIMSLIGDRRKAKQSQNVERYKALDKQIKRECVNAKEKWFNDRCNEIEAMEIATPQLMHETIKNISKTRICCTSGCIKKRDGTLVLSKEEILERWEEYLTELYKDERKDRPGIRKALDGPPITEYEIEHALKKMKRGKATGQDHISVEMITALEDLGIHVLTKLANMIYDTGTFPDELSKSIFIAIPKKIGTTEYELHRTISLMSHVTKIILRVILLRARSKIRPEISEVQYGFMQDKGTRNAIYILRTLEERAIEMQRDIFLCFIDYSKAFDRVKHTELIQMLSELDIDGKDLRLIRNLYWDQKAAIKIGDQISNYVDIKRGVRQGCVLSPDLFSLYSEKVLRGIKDMKGIKINGININNIRYADDTVLIADSEKELQNLVDKVEVESERLGLQLNVKKTYSMVITKKKKTPQCVLKTKCGDVSQVESFVYLGSTLTSDGRSDTEIKRRIGIAKKAFRGLGQVLKNKQISLNTKKRILKCYVWSTLMYGCESWNIIQAMQERLEAAEIWFFKRMLNISWMDRMTNEAILRKANTRRALMTMITTRQLRFLGHVNRKETIEYLAMTGKIEGKRARGRQRMTLMSNVIRRMGGTWTACEVLQASKERRNWTDIIANVERHGT